MVRRVSGGNGFIVGDINDNIPLLVRKTTNENAPVSSAAVQDDDELFFAVEAQAIYLVEGFFRFTAANNTMDMRLNYSMPAGATFSRFELGAPVASTAAADVVDMSVATTADVVRGAGTVQRTIIMWGDLQIGATPGTFRTRFGQSTSDAGILTMNLGSWLRAYKL